MVRVLPEDDDADGVERRQRERVEDSVGRRVEAAPRRDLGDEEVAEPLHGRLLELVAEDGQPALVHPRLHRGSLRRRDDGRVARHTKVISLTIIRWMRPVFETESSCASRFSLP